MLSQSFGTLPPVSNAVSTSSSDLSSGLQFIDFLASYYPRPYHRPFVPAPANPTDKMPAAPKQRKIAIVGSRSVGMNSLRPVLPTLYFALLRFTLIGVVRCGVVLYCLTY
jgi:hypothetical protein